MLLGDEWRHDVLSCSSVVFFTWGPVVLKLASTLSVTEPMVFHVHFFQFFDAVVVDNTKCSGCPFALELEVGHDP